MSEKVTLTISERARKLAIAVFVIGGITGVILFILFGATNNLTFGIVGFGVLGGTMVLIPMIYVFSAISLKVRSKREMERMKEFVRAHPMYTEPYYQPPPKAVSSQASGPSDPKLILVDMLLEASRLCNAWNFEPGLKIYEKALAFAKKNKLPTAEIESSIAYHRERQKAEQEFKQNKQSP
jgi:hypothetical protein